MPRALRTTFLFVLIGGGLGALVTYYLTVPVIPGASFLLSGIVYLLVALLRGSAAGAAAAFLSSIPTMWMWGEPTTLITRPLEAFVTGWLVQKRRMLAIYANLIFWVVAGVPLVYLVQYFGPNLQGTMLWIVLLKQPLNGLLNIIVASTLADSALGRPWNTDPSHRQRPPLRAILVQYTILLILCTSIGVSMFRARSSWLDAEKEMTTHLKETVSSAANQVTAHLKEHSDAILALKADLEREAKFDTPYLNRALDETRKIYPGFLTMLVAGKDGIKVGASPLLSADGQSVLENQTPITDREYFQKALETKQPFLSGVFRGRGFGRDPVVALSAPLLSQKGEVFGIVEGSLDLRSFQDVEGDHGDLDVIILDHLNRVVYATPPTGYAFLQDLSGDALLREYRRLNGPETFSFMREAGPAVGLQMTATAKAGPQDWTVFVQHAHSMVEADVERLLWGGLLSVFGVVVIMLGVVELVARRTTRPIEHLAGGVRRFAMRGTAPDVSVPDSAPAEVATLMEDFQQMAGRLETSHRELQSFIADLDEKVRTRTQQLAGEKTILEKIAAGETLPKILQMICREMEKARPEMLCSILLVDPIHQCLRPGAAPSLPQEYAQVVDGMKIGPGGSPCSSSAQSREREVVVDFESDPRYAHVRELARQFSVRSCWSTPILSTDGDVLGTFGIYLRAPRAPDTADFEIIERGSNLAAIAMQRRRDQEQIRLQSQKQQDILDSLLPFVGLFGLDGTVLEVNRAALNSLGIKREELVGKSFFDSPWFAYDPQVQKLYRDNFARAAAGETVRFDAPARVAGNTTLNVDNIFGPMRDPSGKVVQVVGSAVDITERTHLGDQLRQAQKMEAIGRLSAGVAHDFNNLLMVIRGHAEMLLDRITDNPAKKSAEEIERAADRAAALTNQLLAFSRKQVLTPRSLDLNAVLAEMESLLRRLIGEHIDLAFTAGKSLGNIHADKGQIEQVVMNLAVNARDAMPNGGKLTLQTVQHRQSASDRQHLDLTPGEYVLLSVRDTGIGMDAETRTRLFEPFFTTKGLGKGTGLGLATVYGIVKQTGGTIDVESRIGHGTEFRVYLPVDAAPAKISMEAASSQAPVQEISETVLLVEDEVALRDVAKEYLEGLGYRVFTAGGGDEALRFVASYPEPIDLLVTDVIMPGMSGRDLAARIQQLRPSVRVLFVSGYIADDLVHREGLDEQTSFLQKPFSLTALASKLREVLTQP